MGQEQSKAIDSLVADPKRMDLSPPSINNSPPSTESLLAEAMAFDNEDESASLEVKAQKALEFPCIQNLMKSTAEVLKRKTQIVCNHLWRCKNVFSPTPMHFQRKYWKTMKSRYRRNQWTITKLSLLDGR